MYWGSSFEVCIIRCARVGYDCVTAQATVAAAAAAAAAIRVTALCSCDQSLVGWGRDELLLLGRMLSFPYNHTRSRR
jgi:hypothetical protein